MSQSALLVLIADELARCSADLLALQDVLADHRLAPMPPEAILRFQSLDRITQINQSLSVLSDHLATIAVTGRTLTLDDIIALPILEEIKVKADPARSDHDTDEDGFTHWF